MSEKTTVERDHPGFRLPASSAGHEYEPAEVAGSRKPGGAAGRSLAEHSLVQLTLVRFREFLREPEAVFWTFVFPILLAAGLGIAFRHRPPEVSRVGVVAGAPEAGQEAPPPLAIAS